MGSLKIGFTNSFTVISVLKTVVVNTIQDISSPEFFVALFGSSHEMVKQRQFFY